MRLAVASTETYPISEKLMLTTEFHKGEFINDDSPVPKDPDPKAKLR